MFALTETIISYMALAAVLLSLIILFSSTKPRLQRLWCATWIWSMLSIFIYSLWG